MITYNQVYKSCSPKDYGDIIRYQVVSVGANIAMLRNCATLRESFIDKDELLDLFELDNDNFNRLNLS